MLLRYNRQPAIKSNPRFNLTAELILQELKISLPVILQKSILCIFEYSRHIRWRPVGSHITGNAQLFRRDIFDRKRWAMPRCIHFGSFLPTVV